MNRYGVVHFNLQHSISDPSYNISSYPSKCEGTSRESLCEGIQLGRHSTTAYGAGNQLPFIIYHCNSSFNLVGIASIRPDREREREKDISEQSFSELSWNRAAFSAGSGPVSPVKAIGIESTTQPKYPQSPLRPSQTPSVPVSPHGAQLNKSQSDNYFSGLSYAFCSLFFSPSSGPIEFSPPLPSSCYYSC